MEQLKKQPSGLATLAIFAIYFLTMGIGTVTPALNSIIGYWGSQGEPVSNILLVSTLPTLTMVVTMLIIGPLAGKKVKYKTLSILGCACFGLFGAMPAVFTSSFTFVLVCRALFGVGLGLLAPLGNALVLGLYEGDKQASYLGYGSLVMNLGGIILQLLGGALSPSVATWNMCFWAHALGFVSMILCFFLPEPPKAPESPTGEKAKGKIPSYVWIASIMLFLLNLVNYALLMNSSVWVSFAVTDQTQVSFIAAIATSFFTVGGMISSAIFGKVFGKLGNKTLALGALCMAIGAILMFVCGSAWILIVIGFVFDGFGFCLVLPGVMAFVGMTTPLQSQAMGISIVTAIMNLAGFVCTYYLIGIVAPIFQGMGHANDTTGYYYGEFIAAAVVFVVLAVVFFIHNPAKNALPPQQKAPEEK